MDIPSHESKFPLEGLGYDIDHTRIAFIKNVITRGNVVVGDYSYYDNPNGAQDFENICVLYHYPHSVEKLYIGKFCSIANEVKIIMASANHKLDGFSTYPFPVFGKDWMSAYDILNLPNKKDTIIENDVWIGYGATIMPGVKIGAGAVVGAMSVVTKDVEPYTIVGGNSAKLIRKRFSDDVIRDLLEIAWCDWSVEKITANVKAITRADIAQLKQCV